MNTSPRVHALFYSIGVDSAIGRLLVVLFSESMGHRKKKARHTAAALCLSGIRFLYGAPFQGSTDRRDSRWGGPWFIFLFFACIGGHGSVCVRTGMTDSRVHGGFVGVPEDQDAKDPGRGSNWRRKVGYRCCCCGKRSPSWR